MFFFGAMNLKDNRVDRMLAARGIESVDVYYSPIASWIYCLIMLIGVTLPLFFQFDLLLFYPLFLIYPLSGYLVAGYLNNSFAITEKQIHIINPNFPFRQFKSYFLSEIELVTIDKTTMKWHHIFCVLGDNYVAIKSGSNADKYFCAGLELDAFDENWTEKTIDTFDHTLRQKKVPVRFKLDHDQL
jgi:hypothetical protein